MRIGRFALLFGAMVLFAGCFGTSVGALIGYGLPGSVMDVDQELSGGRYLPKVPAALRPDAEDAAAKGAALGAAFGLLLGIVLAFPLALFDQLLLVVTGWRDGRKGAARSPPTG